MRKMRKTKVYTEGGCVSELEPLHLCLGSEDESGRKAEEAGSPPPKIQSPSHMNKVWFFAGL